MPLIQRQAPYPHWEFTDPASGDQLRLVPERGGLVTGWVCCGRELLYFDAERFADPAKSVRGGIPVLFPICGNLPGNRLELAQGSYPIGQHGFARDLPWAIRLLDDLRGVRLSLVDTPATRAAFPFPFELVLELRLAASALAITAKVDHRLEAGQGPEPMPFSLGLHPYFAVSSLAAAALEGLPPRCFDHLPMAEADTASQLARLGQGVDFLCQPSGPVRLLDREAGYAITLQPSAPLDLAVVWSEPPRPMVCLEPWTGPRGSLASGDRRLSLAPGEQLSLSCRYDLGLA